MNFRRRNAPNADRLPQKRRVRCWDVDNNPIEIPEEYSDPDFQSFVKESDIQTPETLREWKNAYDYFRQESLQKRFSR